MRFAMNEIIVVCPHLGPSFRGQPRDPDSMKVEADECGMKNMSGWDPHVHRIHSERLLSPSLCLHSDTDALDWHVGAVRAPSITRHPFVPPITTPLFRSLKGKTDWAFVGSSLLGPGF